MRLRWCTLCRFTRLSCRMASRRRFSWFSTTLLFLSGSELRLTVSVSDSWERGREGEREGGREGRRERGREREREKRRDRGMEGGNVRGWQLYASHMVSSQPWHGRFAYSPPHCCEPCPDAASSSWTVTCIIAIHV